MLQQKSAIKTLDQEMELYKALIKSTGQVMIIIDKNKYITNIYNIDRISNVGLSAGLIEVGKHISFYIEDSFSPFYYTHNTINESIDKVLETKKTVEIEYKILDSYLRVTISIIQDENILIQAKNITKSTQKLQELESNNYKELSMALTAGGLTSWSYDVETRILSSSHHNNIIGEKILFDEILLRILPEFRQTVTSLFDDIIDKRIVHGEMTIRVINQQGDVEWVNIHAMPHLYDSNGNVKVIMGSQKDITDQYEYEKKLNQLNKQNELILDNMSSALVYITPEFQVIWENVSKVFQDHEAKEYYATGTRCYSSFNRDTPCENCVMLQAMQTRERESIEFTDQSGQSFEIVANPILRENNLIEGIVLKIDNITEKKNTIQRLKEAEQEASAANRLLYTILDNLPSSFFVKNANDNYKYIIANKRFCLNFGMSEKEIIGKTDYDIFLSKEEADRYRFDDIDAVENNQTKIIDGEFVSLKEGIAVWHTVKAPLIDPDDNDKKLLVGIGVDITDSHNAYQELAVAKKKAEESDVLKSAFLANMSHEIRTPLNAIIGFSELLKDTDDEKDKEEYWNIIRTNNDLLLRLINDILDLSKIESGMVELKSIEFDLSEQFNEIYSMLKLRNSGNKINFICENPYKKCIVTLDSNRMTQIITNFVTNAFKFTPRGEIKMGYEYIDNGIRFYCTDTGIGIAPEKIDKVFARFSKLDDFAQGTGLGTSICKAIVDAYGGKIGVTSVLDEGSTFWAWIPCNADID